MKERKNAFSPFSLFIIMEQLIIVGKILKTRGLQGELLVQIESGFPQHIVAGQFLLIGKSSDLTTPYAIESLAYDGRNVRLWLVGLESREAVESLTGCYIYSPESQLEKLDTDDFY